MEEERGIQTKKVILIGAGISAYASILAQNDALVTVHDGREEKSTIEKLIEKESQHLISRTYKLSDEFTSLFGDNRGKLFKQLNNKSNPKSIKPKYNGKSSPFKQKKSTNK